MYHSFCVKSPECSDVIQLCAIHSLRMEYLSTNTHVLKRSLPINFKEGTIIKKMKQDIIIFFNHDSDLKKRNNLYSNNLINKL